MTHTEHLLGLQPPAHWTVANNYRLRTLSFAIMFLSVLFHGWDKGYSPILWGLIAVQLLIYPHIVFLLARRSINAQHAELNNLTLDCLMFGALAAALQFPLWIAFTVYIASTLNITISGGLPGLLRSQLAFIAGVLLVGLLVGWHLSPGTEWPATIVCIVGNTVYMVAIGLTAFGRNRQLRQTREALRKGENTLRQQLVEIQSLQDKLQEQAVRDPLTGLYNRRFLDTIVARELARCEREGLHLTVMMIDVDHFKKVNDTYGHQGGDEVLKKLATLLLDKVRVIDVACRFGGEEFLLMLPSMSPEFAIVRAEQCREAFAQAIIHFEGQTIQATMSIGIAVYPQHGNTLSELTRCADVALYQAKEAGRNRVVLYTAGS